VDELYKFPIYAIFIGANLGIASVSFLQKIFEDFAIWWLKGIMDALIISAGLCIFSSNLFFSNGSKYCAYVAIFLLLLSYATILVLSWFLPGRTKQISGAIRFTSAISRKAGELLEKRLKR
jgi:hypothetical protein